MQLEFFTKNAVLNIILKGDYLNYDDNLAKSELLGKLKNNRINKIYINTQKLVNWDSTLVVILFEIFKSAKQKNIEINYNDLPKNLYNLVELALAVDRKPEQNQKKQKDILEKVGSKTIAIWQSINRGLRFIKNVINSLKRYMLRVAIFREIDFLFALEDCGYKAVGIVSLVSFMVGLILAFVGAIQLKIFGAQIYVASLVTIAMTRIMGAIMVGVVMAGRTGAQYAATIGTMQVNEEIDALKTMGIPVVDFLVLPRIVALTITIPLLTILADMMGVLGGMAVGVGMLNIAAEEYWNYTLKSLGMNNFLVGLFHALVFGIIISVCGCYFGIYCGRNADSVGKATTQAVVYAVVWMIVATGIITFLLQVFKL